MSMSTTGKRQRAVFEAAGVSPAVLIPPVLAGMAASALLVGSALVN